jgi:hypothetical protein
MRYALTIGLAILLWGSVNGPAHAFGCVPCFYYFCPPVCCVTYQYQTTTSYRPEWRAEQVPCVVQKVSYRQETTKVPVTVYVPKMFDEKVKISYYEATPKIVEQPVTTCVMVPAMSFDPCTGCCYATWCPQWVTHTVRCTAYDYKLKTRDDVVKVCRMVPEPHVVDQVRWISEVTQEPSTTVRYSCVMVPCQTTVCVPIYTWCYP